MLEVRRPLDRGASPHEFTILAIGSRCALIFSLIALLTLAIGVTAILQTRSMNASAEQVRQHWLPGVMATGDISNHLGRIRSLALRNFIEQDVEDVRRIESLKGDVSSALAEYEKTLHSEEDRALFTAFSREYANYLTILDKVLAAQGDKAATMNTIKHELSLRPTA